uniref:Uncharacterized protein n=1 Tax=viral metagenome TaxID=1070528 RepID=A0A6M3KQR9_9ZZZZ
MLDLIKDMFTQLGIDPIYTEVKGIIYVNVRKSYLHYDEIEPFTKYNSFKGISAVDGQLLMQFIA